MMQENKEDVIEKVLDYWYMMEFLSQDNWPRWKEKDSKRARMAKEEERKRRMAAETGQRYEPPEHSVSMLQMCCELSAGQDIYECVRQSAEEHGMTRWGNITVYAGQIKREICINKIAESIKNTDDRAEKSHDKIAWASLQLGPDGSYLGKSFSLSPVIWAVGQIACVKTVKSMSQVLDLKEYMSEQNGYDEIFSRIEEEGKKGVEETAETEYGDADEKKYELDETGNYIKKAEYALSKKQIMEQMNRIYEYYIDKSLWKELDEEWHNTSSDERIKFFLSYRLFREEKERERYGDEEYNGLSKTYFSADIDMIRNRAKELAESEAPMAQALLDYIYSGYEEYYGEEKGNRIDLLQKEMSDVNADKLKERYLNILNVKNAPQGKWPSRFMPAFMQQVAINKSINNEGPIFSVNGPPGTGKTTMLKEIIVHNVVERAKLLAAYSDPADAFFACQFQDGDKKHNAYSKYAQHYYVLKDDRINNYSVLVASCNNAAVANITKELPLEQGILQNLKVKDDDSCIMESGLREIEQLFSVDKNEEAKWLEEEDSKRKERNLESWKTENNKWNRDCHDIYFTRYARDLLGKEEVWGLTAATLGKKKNVREFYQNVMKPLEYVIVGGTEDERKKRRLDEYRSIRNKFHEQLDVVMLEQNERSNTICNLENDIKEKQNRLRKEEKKLEEWIIQLDGEKCLEKIVTEGLIKRLQELEEEKKREKWRIDTVRRESQEKWMKCQSWKQSQKQLMEEIVKKEECLTLFDKVCKTRKAKDIWKLQEIYRAESIELGQNIERVGAEICGCNREEQQIVNRLNVIEQEGMNLCADLQAKQNAYKCRITEIEEKKRDYEITVEELRKELKKDKELFERIYPVPEEWDDTEKFVWLNDEFMQDILSEDEGKSTKAQVSNPWFDEAYNREREKLFYYALRLHEAFILASQACRENLINLGMFWQLRNNEENKRVNFSRRDREAAIGPLLQTLFLLVPVLSTTFASVKGFLGDAGEGTVGMLIVDEAGQASPQMAIGALYRSRKAVIVGDPKQIEPVVTDELRLIRQAYNEKLYKPYIRKLVSVQQFADYLNPYGTFFYDNLGEKEWVGCPLVVHRRCISPMYEISNMMSYSGIMKQQTNLPSQDKEKMFCYPSSRWINVKGKENGKKDHFVPRQGEVVIEMLEKAFKTSEYPNIYIISPFKSVVEGMKERLKEYYQNLKTQESQKAENVKRWSNTNIGTVHTFQGKEADEVIFLLGCDMSNEAEGAIRWVNSNVVNVAVTRAKYRLYLVGDACAWKKSEYIEQAMMRLEYQEWNS